MITTLLLAGALAQTGPAPDPGALAAMLAGAWDNAAQIEAEADPARPHLHVRHEMIDADGLDGAALYAELRVGGPEGEVYRQRVYVIGPAPGGADLTMAVYELANPERFARADDAARAAVSADELVRFDPGCDFVWRQSASGWAGEIEDDACVRTSSRSGRDMVIGADFTISAGAFTHSEFGRYADTGESVFGPPDGVANIYDRVNE
jgi:hypothetical protein